MTTFDCLPFDVIDYILNSDCFSYVDVCRLASVSKIFNCIAKSNKLWKKKWPELAGLYDAQYTHWKHEFRMRFEYKKSIFKKLSELSVEQYLHENVSNEAFFYFRDIALNHRFGFILIINELERIINDENSHLNLTHKYYALRALRYMRHLQLEADWKTYLSQPSSKLSLVEGSCLISQWCQPTMPKCTSEVVSQIDEIAKHVIDKVQQRHPYHPVIKRGLTNVTCSVFQRERLQFSRLEDRYTTKNDMLSESLWTPRQCKDIIQCINTVIFQDLKFTGSQIDYYSADTTFIDKVLTKKSGISITLGVIYAAVAARLGISCLAVNFPGHFLLKWLEHPGKEDRDAYTFIDPVENGTFKSYDDLPDLAPGYQTFTSSWTEAVPAIKVFIRLAWYLVEFGRQMDGVGEDSLSLCNALELLCLLSPDDMEHKLLLARLFMHLGINITEAISMLQEIAAHDPLSPLTVGYMYQSTLNTLETQKISRPLARKKLALRDEMKDLKFAVGMIMKHIKYNFRCVIYGWDYSCSASRDWIKRMGVNNLVYRDKQPFYYVLVDDGTNRYAAQENLEIDKEEKPIPHTKVGRYFESYHGKYYLPNEQTLSEYPQDNEARERALHQAEVEENQ